jgi:hypothetical protein
MSCGAGARRIEILDTANTNAHFTLVSYEKHEKLAMGLKSFKLKAPIERRTVFCAHSAPG